MIRLHEALVNIFLHLGGDFVQHIGHLRLKCRVAFYAFALLGFRAGFAAFQRAEVNPFVVWHGNGESFCVLWFYHITRKGGVSTGIIHQAMLQVWFLPFLPAVLLSDTSHKL